MKKALDKIEEFLDNICQTYFEIEPDDPGFDVCLIRFAPDQPLPSEHDILYSYFKTLNQLLGKFEGIYFFSWMFYLYCEGGDDDVFIKVKLRGRYFEKTKT